MHVCLAAIRSSFKSSAITEHFCICQAHTLSLLAISSAENNPLLATDL